MKKALVTSRQLPLERLEALASLLRDCQPEFPENRAVWCNIINGIGEWLYEGRHQRAMNKEWFLGRCGMLTK